MSLRVEYFIRALKVLIRKRYSERSRETDERDCLCASRTWNNVHSLFLALYQRNDYVLMEVHITSGEIYRYVH